MASLNNQARLAEWSAEALPFLGNTEKTSSELTESTEDRNSAPAYKHLRAVLSHKYALIHAFIWLLYTVLFMSTSTKIGCTNGLIGYSPAQEAEDYELRAVDGLAEGSIYAGYPSQESDAAWGDLIKGINIKIYPDEMARLGQTSLMMKDGSGYLAAMGVYHELHCIKRLRKWFYQDYYYPNQTRMEYDERMTHAEHCLEFIRQAAVCHGDTTITSFKWLHDVDGRVVEPTTKEGALHRCVKWDRLSEWAQSRRVDLFDKDLLVTEDDTLHTE